MRYSKLNNFHERRLFDPNKKSDLLELKFYLENSKWRNGCPFYVEYPWEDIPAMCKDKYALHMLSKLK
jgi:hypothetical protein